MKEKLVVLLDNTIKACVDDGSMEDVSFPFIEVDWTKDLAHGDYASNIALMLASRLRKKPRQIAELLCSRMEDGEGIIQRTEIAGPGFINFFIKEGIWTTCLEDVEKQGDRYGHVQIGNGKSVQVEFVSANPTGPLHIGHARGAVVGDVIANILAVAGYTVFREYYINDAGNQMHNLGRSVLYRYRELNGAPAAFPENCYQGDYIRGLAAQVMATHGRTYLNRNEEDIVPVFTDFAAAAILEGIKDDLDVFGVRFDLYFSERDLYKEDGVTRLLAELQAKDFIYRDGDTLWFRTTDYGDEKDRVVVRQNGEPTYFAADIAYHRNKYDRGFDMVIDIWGADHHGYIPRMQAGIQALGHEKDALKIVLIQLVNLLRDGKPVAMSTRSGEFVTMREVIDEVGRDAARYNFLMRRSDSHLDFDLELAKRQSNDNPVYYVQYAHARICSITRIASERDLKVPDYRGTDLTGLVLPEEIALIKAITRFPEVIEGAARLLEPHRLTFYLNDLAALFHSYYNKNKVMSDDSTLTVARLFLVKSIRTALRNGLAILGVSAPEKM